MAYIEEANELMTDATGQSIATAIGNMSATSVGNLAALQTTDKTSLVGAVNEVKSGLTNIETGLTNLQENGSLTFNNSEVSGSNYFTRLCRIGIQVFVMLQFNLTAQCNANTKIYTIPSTFIPTSEAEIPLMSSAQGQLKFGTDGKVYAPANLAGNNVYSAVGMYKLTN